MICEKCQARELKAMRTLESLTPNGSEFVNDPERCEAFVRENRESMMRVVINLTKRVKAAEKRIAEFETEAQHKARDKNDY